MNVYDFEYDNLRLSDFGYIICSFGSKGLQTVSSGSNLTFNTVSVRNGEKHELTSAEYNECLETTFQICKNTCENRDLEMSFDECRDLISWLNRKGFHKIQFLDYNDEYSDVYFEASFNISRIESDGKLCGLELNMITNRPFALHNPISIMFETSEANQERKIINSSDEEGFIYPHMEITVKENGDLSIYNQSEDRNMYIANCEVGERITLDYPIIQTSLSSHKIQNDFNWNFFRLVSTFNYSINQIYISLPCEIKMVYSPIVKVSI